MNGFRMDLAVLVPLLARWPQTPQTLVSGVRLGRGFG